MFETGSFTNQLEFTTFVYAGIVGMHLSPIGLNTGPHTCFAELQVLVSFKLPGHSVANAIMLPWLFSHVLVNHNNGNYHL